MHYALNWKGLRPLDDEHEEGRSGACLSLCKIGIGWERVLIINQLKRLYPLQLRMDKPHLRDNGIDLIVRSYATFILGFRSVSGKNNQIKRILYILF